MKTSSKTLKYIAWSCILNSAVGFLKSDRAPLRDGIISKVLRHAFQNVSCLYIVYDNNVLADIVIKESFIDLQSSIVIAHGDTNETIRNSNGDIIIANVNKNCMGYTLVLSNLSNVIHYKNHFEIMSYFRYIIVTNYYDPNNFQYLSCVYQKQKDVTIVVHSVESNECKIICSMSNWISTLRLNNESPNIFISKYIVPNNQSNVIHVSTFHGPPFVIKEKKRHSVSYDGVEIRIIKEVAAKMDSHVIFSEPTDGLKWGKRTDNGSYTGVQGDVFYKRTDVAVASLWLTHDSVSGFDLSVPWTRICLTFLTPKPKMISTAYLLCTCFDELTWISTLVSIIAFSTISTVLSRFEHCIDKTKSRPPQYSYCVSIFETIRYITLGSPPSNYATHILLKYLITGWYFMSILLATSYSAGYGSVFTVPRYGPRISSVADLVSSDCYWGSTLSYESTLFSSDPRLANFGERFRIEKNTADRKIRIRNRNYVIVVKNLDDYVTGTNTLGEYGKENLILMQECIANYYVSIGLQKNSHYKSTFDNIIRILTSSGIVRHWMKEIINNLNYRYMDNFYHLNQKVANDAFALRIHHIRGVFMFLILGCSLSGVAFVIEWLMAYKG